MNTNKTHNRRSFLKVSAATGGGILFGFQILGCQSEPRLPSFIAPDITIPDAWNTLNGYLKIGSNGIITIMSPNPEIGQNVKTSMPMIVAEELDADWDKVIVQQAKLDTDLYKRQLAGGSQSIRFGWHMLRKAGATARQMLVEAAAKKWNVPSSDLTTDKGVIYHQSSGNSMGYGDIASAALDIEIPEEVTLKEPKDFKIIGRDTRNVDRFSIVQGKPLFGLDLKKEGMLIAMIEHPPAFGMKLQSFDASESLKMPGIRDVFAFNSLPEGTQKQWTDTNAFPELIAIVGTSTWQVLKAKKKLKIRWVQDSEAESTLKHDEAMSTLVSQTPDTPARLDGDPIGAFNKAAKIIEKTYNAPFLAHNTLEPMNFFARVTQDNAAVEGPIQTPEYLRMTLSSVLDLPEDKISIMMTRMGGGFGRRLYGNFAVEAAVISQRMKAPVKLIYTREDDMTQGTYRPAYKVTYRAGLDAQGNLLAFHVKGVGIHGSPVFANRFPAGAVDHYLAENLTQDSNISTGAWRAPRSNFIAIAEQAFLDEVAEAAGKDPIDFRLELFDRVINNPVGSNNDYDPQRYAGVLKLVKEKSNWDTPKPGIGRGVSAYYCHNSYVAQVLDVEIQNKLPKVKKVYCAVDCGIVVNPEGARNQIEGGIVDGIGHTLFSALTFENGSPEQNNFHQYRLIRHKEAPDQIDIFFVDNGIDPTGLGEPSLPPIGAALMNAIYKATGKRRYTLPLVQQETLLG